MGVITRLALLNLLDVSDGIYIPMARGFLYLVVIMDWVSRAVLAWRLSNTLGAEFCVEALEDALFLPSARPTDCETFCAARPECSSFALSPPGGRT